MRIARDAGDFERHGFRRREFFPHDVAWLPKPYPDTYLKLAVRGVPRERAVAGRPAQLNVYSPWIEDLPPDLFDDPAVNWHGQQFGRRGLIATAGLFLERDVATVTLLQSDLCQQIYRSPTLKRLASARLNNRFRYWYLVAANAVLDFALDRGLEAVYFPTAGHILATTPKRVAPELFVEIYDSVARRYRCRRERVDAAEYWSVPVAVNADRIVVLEQVDDDDSSDPPKVICVYHDVEQDVDTAVAPEACRLALDRMLAVERTHEVRVTYNVLGRLFREIAPVIADYDRHSLAFHTYDHRLEDLTQLERCRRIDLQVKGYRPARSVITPELSDHALATWNFEWLMSSAASLRRAAPAIESGIVKIPVHLDDYPLHTGAVSFDAWMAELERELESRRFVGVGFHDCYFDSWLDRYDAILERLKSAGVLETADEVVNRVVWRSALTAANGQRRAALRRS